MMRELTDHEQNLLSTDQWRPLAFLRGEMLEVTHAELRRWEAHALAVEDQRDAALKERDDVLAELARVVAQGDDARSRLGRANDGWAQAIAERDEARTTCKNQAETWLSALAESTAKLKTAVAERDALRKQLDDLRHDYTDKSYWGNT